MGNQQSSQENGEPGFDGDEIGPRLHGFHSGLDGDEREQSPSSPGRRRVPKARLTSSQINEPPTPRKSLKADPSSSPRAPLQSIPPRPAEGDNADAASAEFHLELAQSPSKDLRNEAAKKKKKAKRRRRALAGAAQSSDGISQADSQPSIDFDFPAANGDESHSNEIQDHEPQQANGDTAGAATDEPITGKKKRKRNKHDKKKDKAREEQQEEPAGSPLLDSDPHLSSQLPAEDRAQMEFNDSQEIPEVARSDVDLGESAPLEPVVNGSYATEDQEVDQEEAYSAPLHAESKKRKPRGPSQRDRKKQKRRAGEDQDHTSIPDASQEFIPSSIKNEEINTQESALIESEVPSSIGDIAQRLYQRHVESRNATPKKPKSAVIPNSVERSSFLPPTSAQMSEATEDVDAPMKDELEVGGDEEMTEYSRLRRKSRGVNKSNEVDDLSEVAESIHEMEGQNGNSANGIEKAHLAEATSEKEADGENGNYGGESNEEEHQATETFAEEMDIDEEENDVGVGKKQPKLATTPRIPKPTLEGDDAPSTPRAKSGSSRKRLPKQSYLERAAAENAKNFAELPSPSLAAPTRKKLPERKEALAESSKKAAKPKQRKISAMLGGTSPSTPDSQRSRYSVSRAKYVRPEKVVTGALTEFELRNIDDAVERWRVDHGLSEADMNEYIQQNAREARSNEFWDRVVATCPDRLRQKVINSCRKRFHNFVGRGKWTPEQHQDLSELYELHGNKYKEIGKMINRHPEDVRDRVRNYVVCGDKQNKRAWDPTEVRSLLHFVQEALTAIRKMRPTRPDFEGTTDEDNIDWQGISERLGRTRSRIQCQYKWRALQEERNGEDVEDEPMTTDGKIQQARREVSNLKFSELRRIIEVVKASKARAVSRIPWVKVRSELGNEWPRATIMLAWSRLSAALPHAEVFNVPDVADRLLQAASETGELLFPKEEDIDLNQEYRDLKHKLEKNHQNAFITPAHVHKTDDDEVDEDEADTQVAEGKSLRIQEAKGSKGKGKSKAKRNALDLPASRLNGGDDSEDVDDETTHDEEPTGARNGQGDRDGSLDLGVDESEDTPRTPRARRSSGARTNGRAAKHEPATPTNPSDLTPSNHKAGKSPKASKSASRTPRSAHTQEVEEAVADADEALQSSIQSDRISIVKDLEATGLSPKVNGTKRPRKRKTTPRTGSGKEATEADQSSDTDADHAEDIPAQV